MIMKKFVFIISVVLVALWACNDEDEVSYYQVPGVSAAEDFVDSRDQKVYKCITIGDQIWLAENLAYHLRIGDDNLACRTYEEDYLRSALTADSINVGGDTQYNEEIIARMDADIAAGLIDDAVFDGLMHISDDVRGRLERGSTLDEIFADEYLFPMFENDYGLKPDLRLALLRYEQEIAEKLVDEVNEAAFAENLATAEGENGHYSDSLGYLYSLEGALAALPAEGGWRLPTDEDWKKLERYLGMAESEVERENDWRGTTEGALLKEGEHGIGFNALFAGGKMYSPSYSSWYDDETFSRKGQNAYFWTSEKIAETDSTYLGVIRSVAIFNDQILRTTTRLENEDGHPTMFSVRLVKDKN